MDDITKKILEELVINFISEMNEWEKYCNEFDEDQLELDETEHKIKQMVASIISKYCTDKERKMSRPMLCHGDLKEVMTMIQIRKK